MGEEAKNPLVARNSDSGRWERVRILNFEIYLHYHNQIPKYF